MRTAHQQRVLEFMLRAKQEAPTKPTMPNEKIRLLRAKLILEEALETIEALGFAVRMQDGTNLVSMEAVVLSPELVPDLTEIVDGCCDVSVVTTGTLIACGVEDEPVLLAVDRNNLAKFGPGHSYREDGKLIKPPGHTKVDLGVEINKQLLQ